MLRRSTTLQKTNGKSRIVLLSLSCLSKSGHTAEQTYGCVFFVDNYIKFAPVFADTLSHQDVQKREGCWIWLSNLFEKWIVKCVCSKSCLFVENCTFNLVHDFLHFVWSVATSFHYGWTQGLACQRASICSWPRRISFCNQHKNTHKYMICRGILTRHQTVHGHRDEVHCNKHTFWFSFQCKLHWKLCHTSVLQKACLRCDGRGVTLYRDGVVIQETAPSHPRGSSTDGGSGKTAQTTTIPYVSLTKPCRFWMHVQYMLPHFFSRVWMILFYLVSIKFVIGSNHSYYDSPWPHSVFWLLSALQILVTGQAVPPIVLTCCVCWYVVCDSVRLSMGCCKFVCLYCLDLTSHEI